MTADREEWSELPIAATTATRTRSGTSVIRRSIIVPSRAWVWATTNWSQPQTVAKSTAATASRFVVVEPNHSWWWPYKSQINRKEARIFSVCTAATDDSKQTKIWSSRSGMLLVLLKKKLFRRWNSILLEPGQPSAQLSKLIRLTACKKTKHAVSRR